MSNTSGKTKKLTVLALLTAIVVVLQALAISIRFGIFTITLVLAPIIVGAALYGAAAGGVYRLLEKKNSLLASVCAGICAPVVNTGVFLIGCRLFFYDTVAAWGAAVGFENTALYMIVSFVGVNFLVELGINLVLSSAIVQIIRAGRKGRT